MEISNTESSNQIARYFMSKEHDMNALKEAVSHQIEKVVDNLPPKHKQIFKNKFKGLSVDNRNRNAKI
jgi:DNA-directed RNA polymerase specialized sigma24 family protein